MCSYSKISFVSLLHNGFIAIATDFYVLNCWKKKKEIKLKGFIVFYPVFEHGYLLGGNVSMDIV